MTQRELKEVATQVDERIKGLGARRGVQKSDVIVKGSGEMGMNMTLPGRGRGKETANEPLRVEAKERDKRTTGDPGDDLVELTVQVRVKGTPNQPPGRDRKKAVGNTDRNKTGGDVVAYESSQRGAVIKPRGPEIKGKNTKEEETRVRTGRGYGNTAPGRPPTTNSGKSKQASVAGKKPDRTDDLVPDVKDYLYLLKLLRIRLPEGVICPEVIKVSTNHTCVSSAKSIVTELENLKIQFCVTPRLGCREVKRTLTLKNRGDVLELTKVIFFETTKVEDRKMLMESWKKNSTSTGKGFRMRDRYKNTPISTLEMYSSAITRSMRASLPGDRKPTVTDGVRVNSKEVENLKYSDESLLNGSGSERFGKFHQNKTDEMECLKFVHELGVISVEKEKVRYTKGNKVDCGFLTGRLDFLANIQKTSGRTSAGAYEKDERLVIECKGTTGDMVGKVFTKTQNSEAQLITSHEYCYQAQAYMYVLNQEAGLLRKPLSKRAVMVIRHYHGGGNSPQDFHWNYLQLDENIQTDIDELRAYCEREVLACFLAVLNLIFQKEIT